MNDIKLFKTLTKVDVILKWFLKEGLTLLIFTLILILFVFIFIQLLF